MNNGVFITFEGGEGSGKSTQIQLLKDYFEQEGQSVLLTREPGGSAGAEEIRNLLLKGGTDRWDKKTEMLLFTAARRDHLIKKIFPALREGKIILSDRFQDSTVAYQCFGYGYDENIFNDAKALYQFIAGDFKPNITIVLDIDPKIGLSRSIKRQGNDEQRFENMDFSFHENIRKAFLTLAQSEPNRFIVVDANQPIQAIHEEIVSKVKEKMNA